MDNFFGLRPNDAEWIAAEQAKQQVERQAGSPSELRHALMQEVYSWIAGTNDHKMVPKSGNDIVDQQK